MNLIDKYVLECRARVTFPEKIRFRFLCNNNPVLLNEGFRMFLNPKDIGLSRQLWCRGFREPVCTRKYREILKPDMVVLDIGSNSGYYPLVALTRIVSGKVICFEPHPKNFELLEKNLKLNFIPPERYSIYNMAVVHDEQQNVFISDDKHFNWCKLSDKGIKVSSTTLLDIDFKPDMVRMDIEGYEYELIPSMKEIFKNCDYAFIEIHPYLIEQQYSDNWYNIIDVLEKCGLIPFYVVKEYGSYHEMGCHCDKRYFYKVIDTIGINKNYTCGLGLFFKTEVEK